MLLRSASTPILNSWGRNSNELLASPEPEFRHQTPKSRSIALATSSPSSASDASVRRMSRALSETDLRELSSVPKRRSVAEVVEERDTEEEEEEDLGGLILTSSGLDVAVEEEAGLGGDGGGGWDRRRGRFGNGDGNMGGSEGTERYYQKMIEADPGNSLLLGNYARFLKEVRGDYAKAEEYCGRAILANPNDANILSLYADLTWQMHNDASRAEFYFDQAVKAAPEDCYVMASYAKFLWDAEEDEEDEGETSSSVLPGFVQGVHPMPPVAAASFSTDSARKCQLGKLIASYRKAIQIREGAD